MAERSGRRVRLRDVAEHAGVSIGSASQAFGRPELVSEQVRRRVLEAAEELGYGGPDPAARRLRTGRAGAYGLIFTERLGYAFTDPAAPAFLRGVAWGMEEATAPGCFSSDLALARQGQRSGARGRRRRLHRLLGASQRSACRGGARPRAAGDHGRPAAGRGHAVRRDRRQGRGAGRRRAPPRARARRVAVPALATAGDPEGTLVFDVAEERLAGYREGLGPAWDENAVRTAMPNAPEPARTGALELLGGSDR